MKYIKGQRVEAYYGDGWYSGVIQEVNGNDTFAVAFDDGDYLEDATFDEIRLPVVGQKENAASLLDFIQAYKIAPTAPELVAETAAPPTVEVILKNVEEFLLPGKQSAAHCPTPMSSESNPRVKLESLLIDAAIREHIRTMQTMYRDDDDELLLGKELRTLTSTYNSSANVNASGGGGGDRREEGGSSTRRGRMDPASCTGGASNVPPPARVSTKELMEKISQDRARAVALCRLCYGDNSLELIRAEIDITASYALRGLWPHVEEKVKRIDGMIHHLTSHYNFAARYEAECNQSVRVARRVACIFDCLRDHVKEYCGQVTSSFGETLRRTLLALEPADDPNLPSSYSSYPGQVSALISSITGYIDAMRNKGIAEAEFNERRRKDLEALYARQVAMHEERADPATSAPAPPPALANTPPVRVSASWGEMVNFLVNDCSVMKAWVLEMQNTLLPQNKAVLQFVFKNSDAQNRGVCHPQQLSNNFTQYPCVVKVLSGTAVAKTLSYLKLEVPMFVDPTSGHVCDIDAIQSGTYKLQDTQRVVYEVPICWEELLALFIVDSPSNVLDILRVHTLILRGMAGIFQKNLMEAEEHMIDALHLLEGMGMEMEAVACELYNSIAQMMIMKHREWHSQKKSRCKAMAEAWVRSPEGERELIDEIKIVLHHYRNKHLPITTEEAEHRSKMVLIKARTTLLMEMEEDATAQSVEAAFRYLVRSLDIMEKAHNSGTHPTIATACLAVASVQNLCNQFEDAREWLMRCLRVMEKLDPVPVRAIAFVHVQLSNVLMKLEHEEESIRILSEACSFYLNKSREGILKHVSRITAAASSGVGGDGMSVPFASSMLHPLHEPIAPQGPSATCYNDVMLTTEYTKRLIKGDAEGFMDNGRFVAIEKCIVLAELLESAFGWDSKDAARQRKEIGDRCMATSDFTRAHENYRRFYDICVMIYGENDRRSAEADKLVQNAWANKIAMQKDAILEVAEGGEGDGGYYNGDDVADPEYAYPSSQQFAAAAQGIHTHQDVAEARQYNHVQQQNQDNLYGGGRNKVGELDLRSVNSNASSRATRSSGGSARGKKSGGGVAGRAGAVGGAASRSRQKSRGTR